MGPSQKIEKKIFFWQLLCKILALFGQVSSKIREFCYFFIHNFFGQKFRAPLKLTEFLLYAYASPNSLEKAIWCRQGGADRWLFYSVIDALVGVLLNYAVVVMQIRWKTIQSKNHCNCHGHLCLLGWCDVERSHVKTTNYFSTMHCESKNPPQFLRHFFQNGWEFLDKILHAYYVFLSTLDCEIFIQLAATLTRLCELMPY